MKTNAITYRFDDKYYNIDDRVQIKSLTNKIGIIKEINNNECNVEVDGNIIKNLQLDKSNLINLSPHYIDIQINNINVKILVVLV